MRRVTILMLVLLVAMSLCTMIACDSTPSQVIEPIEPMEWTEYVNEFSSLLVSNISSIDMNIPFYFDYNILVNGIGKNNRDTKVDIELRGNVIKNGGDGILKVHDLNVDKDILFVYHDNDNLYVKSDESKVVYENAPINDVILKTFRHDENSEFEDKLLSYTTTFLTSIFVDGEATLDKTQYFFDFDFSRGVEGMKNFIDIVPGVLRDIVLREFGIDSIEEMYSRLRDIKGKMTANIVNGKVTSLVIDNIDDDGANIGTISVSRMATSNGAIIVDRKKPIEGNFISKKLGDFVYEGSIDLMDGDYKMSTYDIMVNSNIDILQLYINDFDMETLSDDNYFHMRIGHSCRGEVGNAYCDAKYMKPEGVVLELAYSPRDFGTKSLYFVASPRAFFNREAVDVIDNGIITDLLMRVVPDYRLFAIDTKDQIARLVVMLDSDIDTRMRFFSEVSSYVNSSLDGDRFVLNIDYLSVLSMLPIPDNYMNGVRAIFGDGTHYANRLVFSMMKTEMRDYDIANMAIHIIDKNSSSTKNYVTYSDSGADPAISWDYYEYSMDGDTQVHNIYDENGDLIYGVNAPISRDELPSLEGATIKYSYVNYDGIEKGKDGSMMTDIIEVLDVLEGDNGYSRVRVKVHYPSLWTGLINENIKDYVDTFLYDIVELNVKFEDIHARDVRFVSKSEYYYGENIPRDILDGIATIKYASGQKDIRVKGECSTIGDFLNSGIHIVTFDVVGERIDREINVLDKSVNLGADISFAFNGYGDNIVKIGDVWHIRVEYGERIRDTQVFDKILLNIHHRDDYTSTRSIERKDMYYVHDGTRHYLDEEFRGVWWIDSSDNIVFNRVGEYVIETNAGGMTKNAHIVIDVRSSDAVDESLYHIVDKTYYRNNYFAGYAYDYDFAIANSYHGTVGKTNLPINIRIYRGYTNTQGNLSFQLVENIEEYADIKEIRISGLNSYNNGKFGAVDLPPSIKNNADISLKISFKQSGYYKVAILLGNYNKKTDIIRVEDAIAPIG